VVCPNTRALKNRNLLALKLSESRAAELQVSFVLKYLFMSNMCLQSFVATLSVSQCHKLVVEAYDQPGGVQIAKARVDGNDQQQQPPQPPDKPNRCICGRCRVMGESWENICCRRRPCIATTTDPFSTLVLNTNVLAVAISHSADHYVQVADFNPASYRKAAYRQWTLWQHGHLGGANRRVIPSCVVLAICRKFPDGVYMGFRESRADQEH